jgi:hypothetical protein
LRFGDKRLINRKIVRRLLRQQGLDGAATPHST